LSFLPQLGVVYHEHDSPGVGVTLFDRLCMSFRWGLARRAAACVLPNSQRADWFKGQTGASNVFCVWNCPRRDEGTKPHARRDDENLRVIYHGSVVPDRLPLTVITAMARLPATVQLIIVGYETIGHAGYLAQLRRAAEQHGVSDRLQIRDSVPRYDLLRICQTCDIGLALMPNRSSDVNFRKMVGASNKAFDYLACGLPLVVSDLPDWRQLFVSSGYALACDPDDPPSIAYALGWFLDNRDRARAMGELGRQRIANQWNYETQFYPIWARLQQTGFRNRRAVPRSHSAHGRSGADLDEQCQFVRAVVSPEELLPNYVPQGQDDGLRTSPGHFPSPPTR
jgi:glycosyltransferase involved in cell wall biosynthesis